MLVLVTNTVAVMQGDDGLMGWWTVKFFEHLGLTVFGLCSPGKYFENALLLARVARNQEEGGSGAGGVQEDCDAVEVVVAGKRVSKQRENLFGQGNVYAHNNNNSNSLNRLLRAEALVSNPLYSKGRIERKINRPLSNTTQRSSWNSYSYVQVDLSNSPRIPKSAPP